MTKTRSKKRPRLTPEERREKLDEAKAKLEEGVSRIMDSDEFKKYLRFMGSFHSYSANNVMLIHIQNQNATMVAGYGDWQKKGRQVMKRPDGVKPGEWGIKILAPLKFKSTDEKTGEEEYHVGGFKVVTVFDVSQTEGDPIPTGPEARELDGEDAADALNAAVLDVALDKNCDVSDAPDERFDDNPGLKGWYDRYTKAIRIRPGLSANHATKTLVHELVHHVLHGKEAPHQDAHLKVREVQAEGSAYTVLSYFGIDTSDYSFPYLATWGENRDALKGALSVIQKTAHELIEAIESAWKEPDVDTD